MKRLLLLTPASGYRNRDFQAAAQHLGVEVLASANYCHQLAPTWGMSDMLALPFDRPEQAMETVLRELKEPIDAVLSVDDSGVELAALLAERLGLAGNPPAVVRGMRDKLAFRALQAEHGLRSPRFAHLASDADPSELLSRMNLPLVIKARRLGASRGVIRADDGAGLERAVARVRAIQRRADRDAEALGLVVEEFIPGKEYALEGLVEQGRLRTLALFDKPDPLDGPYFEETIYVTPSRLPLAQQELIGAEVARTCERAGLRTGPIHAEVRVNPEGVWVLELATRSIGGLCGRVLRQGLGMGLEELILRHLLGQPIEPKTPDRAAGVMMIPIPHQGIYQGVTGVEQARLMDGIKDVTITAEAGQRLAPPPDGDSYLGFIFSEAKDPAQAEAALRLAHQALRLDIRPEYGAA